MICVRIFFVKHLTQETSVEFETQVPVHSQVDAYRTNLLRLKISGMPCCHDDDRFPELARSIRNARRDFREHFAQAVFPRTKFNPRRDDYRNTWTRYPSRDEIRGGSSLSPSLSFSEFYAQRSRRNIPPVREHTRARVHRRELMIRTRVNRLL